MRAVLRRLARPIRQQVVQPLMRHASRAALGYDITRLGQHLDELESKLRLTVEPHRLWLYENRLERMDATVDIFDAQRRAFHLARYEFASRQVAGKVVADIACGTGYGTEYLVYRGRAARAVGVDLDPEAVTYALQKHRPAQSEFICAPGDATGLATGSIEVVVSFETIEHVPDDSALLREFHRILVPGGCLVISTPHGWPREAGPHHERAYQLPTFRAVLDQQFEVREMHNQNSGSDHPLNHGQPAGIIPTTLGNVQHAECLIAVCRARPR